MTLLMATLLLRCRWHSRWTPKSLMRSKAQTVSTPSATFSYDGNERQCLYDVCCGCCVYGDNRVVDELIQGLPATLDTPEARALQLGQRTKTPVCCLPGCTRHCLILSAGSLPYLIGRLSGCFSPTHNIPLCLLFNCTSVWWATIVGGLNRQRLKDKFKITQPKCSLLGCPIEHGSFMLLVLESSGVGSEAVRVASSKG